MIQIALLTLALGGCGCHADAYSYTYDGSPDCCWKYHPIFYSLPKAIVGCAGPYCLPCNRCNPGGPTFDYRNDFNYPWSQKPCAMYPRQPLRYGPGEFLPGDGPGGEIEEIMPDPGAPEEIPTPSLSDRRQRRAKPVVRTARPSEVKPTARARRATYER